MKIVDLNVLIYAVNKEAAQHEPTRGWWEAALADEEDSVGLAWVVMLGFLRLSTNPAVFPQPLTVEQALDKVDAWLNHENTELVTETQDHWRILRDLLEETGAGGNLTTDAHLASLAISRGAVLVSCDADFTRFSALRTTNPLAG